MMLKIILLIFTLLSGALSDPRIIFLFYHDGTTTEFNTDDFRWIHQNPAFNMARQSVMFHYGADQRLTTTEVDDVIRSYVNRANVNFIVVHYEDSSIITTGNANSFAEGITQSLLHLFEFGYNSGNMNLVGYSIGAQILARASRQIQARSNRRHIIGRLTGLDPWDLGIISGLTTGILNSADAQIVESIHTEGNMRGDHESRGHAAFFVNGGVAQPFCTGILASTRADCSHVFALKVWAEVVSSPTPIFPSLICDSWEQFLEGRCNMNNAAHIGRTSGNNLRGSYFLRTNLQAPFSRNVPFP